MKKKRWGIFKIILIAIICLIIVTKIVPYIINDIQIRIKVQEYLEKKYGDQNFNVVFCHRDYHHTEFSQVFDFSDKYFVGYNVEAKSKEIPSFMVYITGTKFEEMTITDNFLWDYYAMKSGLDEKNTEYIFNKYENWKNVENEAINGEPAKNKCNNLKKYLNNKFELINEIKINKNLDLQIDVPNNYGHIPNKSDLKELVEIKSFEVQAPIDESQKETFMKELKNSLDEYYNYTKTINIDTYKHEKYIEFNVKLQNKN